MAIKTLTGGAFQDSGGNPIALGSISFQLSAAAVVSGTGQVVEDVPITYSLDSSGNIVLSNPTPSLWGNDQLTPSGTFYIVNIFNAAGALVRGPENWVLQGSSPISLTAIVPSTPAVSYSGAIVQTPGADQTINDHNLLPASGNSTQSLGSTAAAWNAELRNANNIRYADAFPGADMGAKIQAAHDDLPSTGGIIDARGIVGVQTWSSTVTTTKPCVLMLGVGTFTYTGSSLALLMTSNNSYVRGSGITGTVLKYNGTSNINFFKWLNGSSGIGYLGVCDCQFQFTAGGHTSVAVYAVDPVAGEFDGLFFSVDGSTVSHNMTAVGLKCEIITTNLVPPRGNIRVANIIHSNSHDGSAGAGAKAIYFKGGSGTNQAFQQISLCGQADIESSDVNLQLEYTSGVTLSGAWYISGGQTANLKGITAQSNVFINPWFNHAQTENCNLDSGCADNLFLNPNFATVTTFGTDAGTRTVIWGTPDAFAVKASGLLPAATGGVGLWISSGYTTPVNGKIYVGDGSGWELDLAKRTGSADTTLFKFKDSGAMSLAAGKIDTYNALTTAGQGLAPILGVTSQRSETAADTNVLTVTPAATVGTYRILFTMAVSAQNTATLGWTATWKDSNGAAQSPTNLSLFTSGTAAPALTVTAATNGNYYGEAIVDVDNSATAIVVKLTFTGTSFTAKVSASVERIQ